MCQRRTHRCRKAGLSPEAAETMILDHIVPLALGGQGSRGIRGQEEKSCMTV